MSETMETYQQIHDFTPAGAGKFADFLGEHATPGLDAAMHKLECLGVIEDNLNGTNAGPLAWELIAVSAADGRAHTFFTELDDFIVEHVDLDQ